MSDEALARYRANQLIRGMRERNQEPPTQPVEAETPCADCPPEDDPVTAASVDDIPVHGLAVPYDTPTGDGRQIRGGALTWDLTTEGVPIIWDREDGDHTGMVIGRVDAFTADEAGVFVDAGRLFATTDTEAQAAVLRVVELIAENAVGWSVMLDDEVQEDVYREPQITENSDGSVTVKHSRADQMLTTVSARIRHLAIVDTPAFPGARPILGPAPVNAAVAAGAVFPAAHFARWEETKDYTPFQITPDGRIWGHAAGDGCYRTTRAGTTCLKYRKDPDPRMANFHTGTATLDNGDVIRAGSLTCANLHATPRMSLDQQRRHHEDTSTVWARVVAWNDSKGRLCISGSVVPGLDERTLAQVGGLPLSVELWPVPGVNGLTLAGAHTVVSPAWPVAASV